MKKILALLLVLALTAAGCSQTAMPAAGAPLTGSAESADVLQYQALDTQNAKLAAGEDIETASYVGYGYDVIHQSYVHRDGVLINPILDQEYVKANLKKSKASEDKTYTTIEDTLYSLYTSFTATANIKSDYPLFSGSVSTEYNTTKNTTTNTHFIKSMGTYPRYSETLKNPNDAVNHLDASFATDLNGTMDPAELYEKYGTSLIIEDVMGARYDFNYTYTSESTESTSDVNVKVQAAYKFVSGSATADETKAAKSFLSRSSLTTMLSGGTSVNTLTLSDLMKNFNAWLDSTKDGSHATIIGFSNSTSLIPLWKLASAPERQSQLKKEYEAQAKANAETLRILPGYVKSIRILSAKDKKEAKNQLYKGYVLIDKDLSKGAGGNYIYISYLPYLPRYGERLPPLVTDIKIVYDKESVPEGYAKDKQDLNAGAGGSYVYICTSTDKKHGKPLTGIDVFYGKNVSMPDGFSVAVNNKSGNAADINRGAGGKYVYIGFKR